MKKYIFTLTILLATLQLQGQDIVKYFVDMPAVMLPSFDKTLKLELLENFLKDNERDSVNNHFGNRAKMLAVDTTGNYLRLKPTSISTFEMKVFRSNGQVIIGVINTVCAPACSSYIHFFDENWQKLVVQLESLKNSDWLLPEQVNSDEEALKWLEKTSYLEYRFLPGENKLEVFNNTLLVLGVEEQRALTPLMQTDPVLLQPDAGFKKWTRIQ